MSGKTGELDRSRNKSEESESDGGYATPCEFADDERPPSPQPLAPSACKYNLSDRVSCLSVFLLSAG